VIRFSAALVAVAIGVLIGGIATSKLLLVYIAIAVSAAALVALAIGVVLKRGELFGDGQELVPAGAGASPAPPLRADESRGNIAPGAHVPLPVPGAAAGYGVPFGGTAPAAAAADLSAARPAAAGQGRSADPAPPWQAPAARDPWSPPVPDWMPAGQGQRAVGAAGGTGSRAPSAWQDTSAGKAPGGAAGGWSVPAADAQAATTAPRSWAGPSPVSVSPEAPPAKPGAGSGATPPSWFDRLGKTADADAPAAPSTSAPGSGGGWADSATSGDEDDDWPTRYSWLDDETDESVEARDDAEAGAAETVAADAGPADAEPEGKSTAPVGPQTARTGTPDAGIADAAVREAAETRADVAPAGPKNAGRLRPASDRDDQEAGLPGEAAAESGAEAASRPGGEPPAAQAATAPGTALVAVVRGVPRYHEADCVLIRFMPEGDVQKMTIPRAREEGCTPCAACQPEG
jgi:hypothetical protein